MNWKEFGLKIFKGAFSGVVAVAGGVFAAGLPMDKHSLIMAAGAIGSAAFHGAWNVLDQYLSGSLTK